jgi:hypothetical protein
MANLRYYIGIFREGVRRTIINLSQNSQSLDPDLNPEAPEYRAGVLPTRPLCTVVFACYRDGNIFNQLFRHQVLS